jgi:hypothetical protein
MLMDFKYHNIHGRNHTAHSEFAMKEFRANNGSKVGNHASYYGLAPNDLLVDGDLGVWKTALTLGPVLAEGHYG